MLIILGILFYHIPWSFSSFRRNLNPKDFGILYKTQKPNKVISIAVPTRSSIFYNIFFHQTCNYRSLRDCRARERLVLLEHGLQRNIFLCRTKSTREPYSRGKVASAIKYLNPFEPNLHLIWFIRRVWGAGTCSYWPHTYMRSLIRGRYWLLLSSIVGGIWKGSWKVMCLASICRVKSGGTQTGVFNWSDECIIMPCSSNR